MEEITIKYSFEYKDAKYGQFNDTLYLDFDKYRGLSREEIKEDSEVIKLKQERIDAWINSNDNPPPSLPPIEDAQARIILMADNMFSTISDDKEEVVMIQKDLPDDAPDWIFSEINNFDSLLTQIEDGLSSFKNG